MTKAHPMLSALCCALLSVLCLSAPQLALASSGDSQADELEIEAAEAPQEQSLPELREYRELPFTLYGATLENGLQVWLQPREGAHTVYGALAFRAGSRYETATSSGASHFLEHMLFTETERWDEGEVKEWIENRGGVWNGITSTEWVKYYGHLGSQHLPELLVWLDQLGFQATLPVEKLERERSVIFQERGGRPSLLMEWFERTFIPPSTSEMFMRSLYPETALQQLVIGEVRSLKDMTYATLERFHERHYQPNNAALFLVGAFDRDQALAQVVSLMGSHPKGDSLPSPGAPPFLPGGEESHWTHPVGEQARLSFGARSVGKDHPDQWLSMVLDYYLKERLFEVLRTERGLIYGVNSYSRGLTNTGHLVWSLRTEADKEEQVRDLIHQELDDLRRGEVDEALLRRVQQQLLGQASISWERSDSRGRWLISNWSSSGGEPWLHKDMLRAMEAVDADALTRAAQTWLSEDQIWWWRRGPMMSPAQMTGGLLLLLGLVLVRTLRRG